MDKKKLLIAGGDIRMLYAAARLSDMYDVELLGYSEEKLPKEEQMIFRKFKGSSDKADILLLPPVVTDNKGRMNAPFGAEEIKVQDVMDKIKEDGAVFMGINGKAAAQAAMELGLSIFNYMEDEALAIANAVPTAEAALKIAMEETGRTIWGSKVLVTGYGRIGMILTDRLIKLGADVTASARKTCDRMKIKAMGAKAEKILPEKSVLSEIDIIFNTVPAEIFGIADIMCLKKECVFIDLASAPGGADKKIIEETGRKYVWASGLPAAVSG